MPYISLLEPTVLRGVVEKFTTPGTLTMLSTIPQTPWPFPSVTWDIIKGSRMIAKPNVPNSEAHIVPRLGRSQAAASFIYLREKKVFEPTTIHWLRQPGQLAATNAEQAVLREVNDLNQRFDNFAEYMIWAALKGTLSFDFPDVQASVDYQFPASHKPTPAVGWDTATPQSIVADIRAWKRLVRRDGRVDIKDAFATELTMAYIFDSFAANGASAPLLLSDRMKDQYYSSGTLPGFMGLNWNTIETIYDDDAGNSTLFVPDNALYMGNYTDQRPIEMMIGPTADDEAPDNYTGKYTKTWKDPDPSARQYLLEWNLLPVITRPEQMLYIADVTLP
jgi:major capsid protein E